MNHLISSCENLFRNFQRFQSDRIKRKNSNEISVIDLDSFLKKHEKRLYQFQNIVLWESPILSFGITLVLTVIFYFLSYCTWKFFASLFSLLLVLSVGEVWVDRIWPEIAVEAPTTDDWLPVNERALSAAEISQKMNLVKENLDKYWKWLINLRKDKPSIFCLSTSCMLFGLFLITWSISGLTLVYLTLLGILCGPALVKRATGSKTVQDYLTDISDFLNSLKDDFKPGQDDKIIPSVTEDNKKLLDIEDSACNVTAPQDPSLESIKNLSDLGVSAMPSYDDASLDSLGYLQDEFALHQGESAELSDADSSDSSPVLGLPKTKSISNTSSSASFVNDARDLEDVDEQEYSTTPTSQGLNLSSLLSNMSKSLWTTPPANVSTPVPSVVRASIPRRRSTTTDDDSEFEMVEHSDLSSS